MRNDSARRGARAAPWLAALGWLAAAAPGPTPVAGGPRLAVENVGTAEAWIRYGDGPALGYGFCPSELLARLPIGEARHPDLDFRDFAEWAPSRGITIARSHPPSGSVGEPFIDLFERSESDPERFDLTRFREDYFVRLRESCRLLRDVGVFVHLRFWDADAWGAAWKGSYYYPANHAEVEWSVEAGPAAPGLIAHQRELVRRILDATGALGNVFYEVPTSPAVDAVLDEVQLWEKGNVRVIVGIEGGGKDRALSAAALADDRIDVVFVDPLRPDLHAAIRERLGKPTFAAWTAHDSGARDPSLARDPDVLTSGLRTCWRMFTARCQMTCLPAEYGRRAYRGGVLDDLTPEDLPGRLVEGLGGTLAHVDSSPERILASPAANTRILLAPRREFAGQYVGGNQAFVLLEGSPGESGTEVPAGLLRLRGVSQLGDNSTQVQVRVHRLDTGEVTVAPHRLRIDDLLLDLPAFRDGLVVSVRHVFPTELVMYTTHSAGESVSTPLRARVNGQTVELEWDRNHVDPTWTRSVAWVQRFPGAEWLGRTSGTRFVDPAAPPGRYVYMIAWREGEGHTALRDPEVAPVSVPDVAPAAPEIIPVADPAGGIALWARGDVAADLRAWEWESRAPGEAWGPVATTHAFLLSFAAARGATGEFRVRVVDAAGNRGPFSEPVLRSP